MSRFDELTLLFDPWRNNWWEQYKRHRFLPPRIAERFQEFLGCPQSFRQGGEKDDPAVPYVSPTHAKWDDQTERFTPYQNRIEDIDFREDGSFYFGLRVYLEHGPNTYPKQPFWFLFLGKYDGDGFIVWEEKSKREFKLDAGAVDEIDALCEHMYELLKDEVSVSPFLRAGKEPSRIGFIPQSS